MAPRNIKLLILENTTKNDNISFKVNLSSTALSNKTLMTDPLKITLLNSKKEKRFTTIEGITLGELQDMAKNNASDTSSSNSTATTSDKTDSSSNASSSTASSENKANNLSAASNMNPNGSTEASLANNTVTSTPSQASSAATPTSSTASAGQYESQTEIVLQIVQALLLLKQVDQAVQLILQ